MSFFYPVDKVLAGIKSNKQKDINFEGFKSAELCQALKALESNTSVIKLDFSKVKLLTKPTTTDAMYDSFI